MTEKQLQEWVDRRKARILWQYTLRRDGIFRFYQTPDSTVMAWRRIDDSWELCPRQPRDVKADQLVCSIADPADVGGYPERGIPKDPDAVAVVKAITGNSSLEQMHAALDALIAKSDKAQATQDAQRVIELGKFQLMRAALYALGSGDEPA